MTYGSKVKEMLKDVRRSNLLHVKIQMKPSLDSRQARRLLEKMGVDLQEIPGVEEVIIRTSSKDIVIKNAGVSELRSKGMRMFQVSGEEVEERVREKPKFTEEDILLVAQQANVPRERAEEALAESGGDLAKAILKLTT